jgi:hypothetical protein
MTFFCGSMKKHKCEFEQYEFVSSIKEMTLKIFDSTLGKQVLGTLVSAEEGNGGFT